MTSRVEETRRAATVTERNSEGKGRKSKEESEGEKSESTSQIAALALALPSRHAEAPKQHGAWFPPFHAPQRRSPRQRTCWRSLSCRSSRRAGGSSRPKCSLATVPPARVHNEPRSNHGARQAAQAKANGASPTTALGTPAAIEVKLRCNKSVRLGVSYY